MKLSACMIVKNEAKMLAETLPSLSQYVDEIIIVDTGSTDETIKVAQKYGAKVSSFAWINDFAAARNESLRLATGDWIIWPDADEFFQERDLKLLRENIQGSNAQALSLTIYESSLGKCEANNGYQRVKVFKNNCGFCFVRPINEQLVDRGNNVVKGLPIPVHIYHWGRNLEAERMSEKRARYIKLYSDALTKQPNDPHLHFLLAMNLEGEKKDEAALLHYTQCVELAGKLDIAKQALERKSGLLLRLKKLKEAAAAATALLEIDPESVQARTVYASIFLVTGKTEAAIEILLEVLSLKTGAPVNNCYQNIAMPNFLLGKAYQIKGDKELAAACFNKAKEICPALYGVN